MGVGDEFLSVLDVWNLATEPPLLTVARTALGKLYLLRNSLAPDGSPATTVLALDPHSGDFHAVSPPAEKFLTRSMASDDYIGPGMQEPETRWEW